MTSGDEAPGDHPDLDAEQAQPAELLRRIRALDAGEIGLIDADEARARIMARLRSVRGR